jgi:hypothetical protein
MIPPWLPAVLAPLAEFLFITLPALVKGTPPPPPPDGQQPGFTGIDAKVDADRAKRREALERTQPTITPLTSTTTTGGTPSGSVSRPPQD